MENDNGLYGGQGLSINQAAHGQMQVQTLKDSASTPITEAAASSTKAWQGFYDSMHTMSEEVSLNRAKVERSGIQDEFETKWKLGFKAAPGSKASWLMSDGTVDSDKISAFADEYMEKLSAVKPSYAGLKASELWEADNEAFIMNARRRLEGQAALQSVDAVKTTGDQVLQGLLEAHDFEGYNREVARQNAAGVRSDAESFLLLRNGDRKRTQYLMQDGVDVIMPSGKRYTTRSDKLSLGQRAIERSGAAAPDDDVEEAVPVSDAIDDGLVPLEGYYEDENGRLHVLSERKTGKKLPTLDGDEGQPAKDKEQDDFDNIFQL